MNLGLDGCAFVVGGASRGLGRAVAHELVQEGARVLLVSRRADALAEAVAALGAGASTTSADLSDPDAPEAIARAVDDVFDGRLDGVLVNHGGPPIGRALELSDEDWRGAFELVLAGPLRVLRTLVPRFRDGASVLFVTSSSVRQPIPNLDASNVLRPGVAALVKCLAEELGPGVRVNSLAPGRFETERGLAVVEARAKELGIPFEEQLATMTADIPLARYGHPGELGRVAAFLLSRAASYVTGVNLQVDGGMVRAVP